MTQQLFLPSLLIPEIYHPVMNDKGYTAGLIEELGSEGFYRSFEICDGFDAEDRGRIRTAAQANGLVITQWLTFFIYRHNLDVSSLDSSLRLETVRRIKENLYLAAECGASNVAFIPGPDPGIERRKEGFEAFYESLCAICEEAASYNLTILVEPLDRDAHKKRLVGPTEEAVALLSRVRQQYLNAGIAFDTAHAALNGEDIEQAIVLAGSCLEQIHFSNAILDKESEGYGDHHMPIGLPGFLTTEKIASILRAVGQPNDPEGKGVRIAMEVRSHEQSDIEQNAKSARTILEAAIQMAGKESA